MEINAGAVVEALASRPCLDDLSFGQRKHQSACNDPHLYAPSTSAAASWLSSSTPHFPTTSKIDLIIFGPARKVTTSYNQAFADLPSTRQQIGEPPKAVWRNFRASSHIEVLARRSSAGTGLASVDLAGDWFRLSTEAEWKGL